MTVLKIANCTLDLSANITNFDENFNKLFIVPVDSEFSFLDNFSLELNFLDVMKSGDRKSFILFYNTKVNQSNEDNALSIFYVMIEKSENYYNVRLTNWLNWLHGVSGSLESSYSLISKFNDNTKYTEFESLSGAACYKALYPLLTYLPNKSSSGVTSISFFNILRVFFKLRDVKFSRDVARNVYSRIRTSLKKEYGHNYADVIDLIKKDDLVNINFNGDIVIPNTTLVSNTMYQINHDKFLLSILDIATI